MTERRLPLREAYMELRECHKRIDRRIEEIASTQDWRCATELRSINAKCRQILDDATARVLALLGEREVRRDS